MSWCAFVICVAADPEKLLSWCAQHYTNKKQWEKSCLLEWTEKNKMPHYLITDSKQSCHFPVVIPSLILSSFPPACFSDYSFSEHKVNDTSEFDSKWTFRVGIVSLSFQKPTCRKVLPHPQVALRWALLAWFSIDYSQQHQKFSECASFSLNNSFFCSGASLTLLTDKFYPDPSFHFHFETSC